MSDHSEDERTGPSRQKFSASEDEALRRLVAHRGPYNWRRIARKMRGRTARQCRDRFVNYLSPALTTEPWSQEEDRVVLEKFREIGPHWSRIAASLPGRSSNAIKNRWYVYLHDRQLEVADPPKKKESASIASQMFLAMLLNRTSPPLA